MTVYEDLINKSNKARDNAKACLTEWSKNYWYGVAQTLREKANAINLNHAKQVYIDELKLQRGY